MMEYSNAVMQYKKFLNARETARRPTAS